MVIDAVEFHRVEASLNKHLETFRGGATEAIEFFLETYLGEVEDEIMTEDEFSRRFVQAEAALRFLLGHHHFISGCPLSEQDR